ncbi:MAG: hypothetical protein ACJ0RC_05895 [Alphaproteobacteria bacterium]
MKKESLILIILLIGLGIYEFKDDRFGLVDKGKLIINNIYSKYFNTGEIIKYSCSSITCYKGNDYKGIPKCIVGWNNKKIYQTGFVIDTKEKIVRISEADNLYAFPIYDLKYGESYQKGRGLGFSIKEGDIEYFFSFNETNNKYEFWYRSHPELQQRHSEKGSCQKE